MEIDNTEVILGAYQEFFDMVVRHIDYKISNLEEAKDIAHDAFLRLLEYKWLIHPKSVKSLLFCIANNIMIDYCRRHNLYNNTVLPEYNYYLAKADKELESTITAMQLAELERKRVAIMPKKRKIIYVLSRYDAKPSDEIAEMLNVSKRTVESHLYQGRLEVRRYIKDCI